MKGDVYLNILAAGVGLQTKASFDLDHLMSIETNLNQLKTQWKRDRGKTTSNSMQPSAATKHESDMSEYVSLTDSFRIEL